MHPRVIRGTLHATAITEPVDAWARLRRTRKFSCCYYKQMRQGLYACDAAKESLRLLFHPSSTPWIASRDLRGTGRADPAGAGHHRSMKLTASSPIWGQLGDGALVLVLAAIGVVVSRKAAHWEPNARHLDVISYALVVGGAVVLAVRRRWPLAAVAVSVTASCTYLAVGYPDGPVIGALAVAAYTAAVWLPTRAATIVCVATVGGLLVHVLDLAAGREGLSAFVGFVPGSAWVVVPFAVGRAVRVGRVAAARSRAQDVQRRTYEERLRIAREVHDVVGHGLAAINMQAEIALHVLPKRPEQAETALVAISRTSKQALDELRLTLAVMRSDDTAAPVTPVLGLGRFSDLIERMSGAGVQVTITVTGAQRDLPTAIEVAAYRVVQEALTNVLRHAGTDSAAVQVAYESSGLVIEVTDSGRGAASENTSGGHGITGMRERVTALGGHLEAGPRSRGGFGVYARLPAPEPSA
jgi:signal transduction histidine kinase